MGRILPSLVRCAQLRDCQVRSQTVQSKDCRSDRRVTCQNSLLCHLYW